MVRQMRSIIQDDWATCYFCRRPATEKHHIYGGYSGIDRKLSEKYGLTVHLCHWCHNEPPNGVHFNKDRDDYLKAVGQRAFSEEHSPELFFNLFLRNYL